jgi:hypothetical protein
MQVRPDLLLSTALHGVLLSAHESGTGDSGLGRSQGTAQPLSGADNAAWGLHICMLVCYRLCTAYPVRCSV